MFRSDFANCLLASLKIQGKIGFVMCQTLSSYGIEDTKKVNCMCKQTKKLFFNVHNNVCHNVDRM